MKYLLIIAFIFLGTSLFGQNTTEQIKGKVSYISSQNTYVQFISTDGIHVGDTLYQSHNNTLQAVLMVKQLSSISCVCSTLDKIQLATSAEIIARRRLETKSMDVVTQKSKDAIAVNDVLIADATNKKESAESKAHIDGRLSVSSYSGFSNYSSSSQRFRYNLALNAEHINNSKLSFSSYISFTHKLNDSIKLSDALKVYNLSLKYDFSKTANLTFGRSINTNMANVGAVDGFQFESRSTNFDYGAVLGSRPDSVYGVSPKLLQFGAFMSYHLKNNNGNFQTSLALFNQMNSFKTDRRFAYIQHSNSLLKNLDLFCSFEIDLYSKTDSVAKNTLNLTGTYISLRYRPLHNLSLSMSYDARKNIYYYETYKNRLDSLMDKATRQGYRFQFNYRPFKKIIWSGNAGYRLQTPSSTSSTNYSTYLTYTQVPFINTSASIFVTSFNANYSNGTEYGINLSHDFLDGRINAEVEYRKGSYELKNNVSTSEQNVALTNLKQQTLEFDLSWMITKKLILSFNFEGTLDSDKNTDSRVFINISQRF